MKCLNCNKELKDGEIPLEGLCNKCFGEKYPRTYNTKITKKDEEIFEKIKNITDKNQKNDASIWLDVIDAFTEVKDGNRVFKIDNKEEK